MPPVRHVLTLATTRPIEFVDLTGRVRDWVRVQGITDGLLTVGSPHTTARIVVNEREPELQGDMVRFLERLAPAGAGYRHDIDTVDDRANAHAHLLGLLMPSTELLTVAGGDLALGTWQALFFLELDGPRPRREVHLQLIRAD